jgi:hypothetical protein
MLAIIRVLINEIDEIYEIGKIYDLLLLLVRMNDIILISSQMSGMFSGFAKPASSPFLGAFTFDDLRSFTLFPLSIRQPFYSSTLLLSYPSTLLQYGGLFEPPGLPSRLHCAHKILKHPASSAMPPEAP